VTTDAVKQYKIKSPLGAGGMLSIELNDDYATAHQWYAIHYLTAQARWDEALAEMKKALELEFWMG
jgi:hypothetical protein